ncbi:hypothetical protein EW145_g2395 [Phellinidium pouzarii]|uniref:Uncharacterized protein n=1 Tax=Phellinidium pouzarii TaxID=167371 RepID=A0A4S4LCX8_9AGAM|nr:hypothetical protein EW145_g2395 [Phellinidium pouzarii]
MPRRQVIVLGQGKGAATAMPPAAAPSTTLSRNPKYIAPQGHRCPIEEFLLPEVLAYIFELGTRSEENMEGWDIVEEDDGDEAFIDVDSDDESDEDDPHSIVLGKVKITDDEQDSDSSDNNDDDETTASEKTRKLSFQVRMSHVCRRWRQVAINTPVLWTKLNFDEPAPFNKSTEWILRSKLSPLDITIDITLPDEISPLVNEATHLLPVVGDRFHESPKMTAIKDEAAHDILIILALILPHVSHWRSFELSVSTYLHMRIALTFLQKCDADSGAPLLETLSLYCHDDNEDQEFEHFVPEEFQGHHYLLFGGNIPKLSQVGLWGVHLDWNMFIPPYERATASLQELPSISTSLTDLELAYHAKDVRPTYDVFVNILRCATRLSSLKITCSGPYLSDDDVVQPMFLPTLRDLRLAFLEVDYACLLLRLIYAPGLTGISLDFDDNDFTLLVHCLTSPMSMPLSPPSHFKEAIYLPPDSNSSQENREVGPSTPASILANVTDMKLSGMPCADTSANLFYAACPRLRRLYLNTHFLPLTFFTHLMQQTEVERVSVHGHAFETARIVVPNSIPSRENVRSTASKRVVCPHLETLTVSGMDSDALVTFVKTRKALGAPLLGLNIDVTDMISSADFAWLRENVKELDLVEISDDESVSVEESDDEDSGGEDEADNGEDGAEVD